MMALKGGLSVGGEVLGWKVRNVLYGLHTNKLTLMELGFGKKTTAECCVDWKKFRKCSPAQRRDADGFWELILDFYAAVSFSFASRRSALLRLADFVTGQIAECPMVINPNGH